MSRAFDPSLEAVKATVTSVKEDYVVTYPNRECGDLRTTDSVTFSLSGWQGKSPPQCGQVVDLIGTALFSRGWRAESASPITPITATKQLAGRLS